MAGMERGIGAFLTGLSDGMKMRQSIDDREWRAKARARQEVEQQQADEDRATNKAWNEKARAQQEKSWSEAEEDRAARLKNDQANQGWLANERARQQGQWGREDALRSALDDAYAAGSAEREKVVAKSVFAAPTQGPTMTGDGALPDQFRVGSRVFKSSDEAREAAEKAAGSVFQFVNGEHVDRVVKAALDAGDRQLAEAYPRWLQDQKVQAGVKHFSDAVGRFSVGDLDGAIDSLNSAYNSRGYFDNGFQTRVAGVKRDESGKPIAADVEFVNEQTGASHVERDVDMNQLFHGAVAMLSPDKVIAFGMEKVKAEQEAAQADAKDRRALALDVAKKRAEAEIKRQEEAGTGANPYASGKFTEAQGRNATFADRAAEAEAILRRNETINSGVSGGAAGLIAGALPAGAANIAASKERQAFDQGQRNFINLVLRRESGAVISDAEFDNARRQYLPQPGDNADTIAQKRASRLSVIKGLMRESGPSYKPPKGWENPGDNGGSQPIPAPPKAASGVGGFRAPTGAPQRATVIDQARAAIAKGANPAVVAERLRGMGFDPKELQQ